MPIESKTFPVKADGIGQRQNVEREFSYQRIGLVEDFLAVVGDNTDDNRWGA